MKNRSLEPLLRVTTSRRRPGIQCLIVALIGCATGFIPAGTTQAQLANLTHRYSFNGDARDNVGGADGVLQGGSSVSGGALVLDGVSGYLALPANLVTGYTAITLETWVTDNGSGSWARIFDFGNNTTDYMFLSLPAGGGNLRGAYTTNGNGSEQVLQWSGGRPVVGQQAHIVWTTDAATKVGRLYVNGLQVGVNSNMTLTPAALGPTVNNWLGRSQFGADAYFNGTIDEFRIYNLALSSNAVVQDYQAGPNGLDNGPVYFSLQPQSQTVTELNPVTFSAGVVGLPPLSLQWYRTNAPIPGATNSALTFTATRADNNATFQLWATNAVTNTTFVAASSNVVLTVLADTNPPVLLGAQSVWTNAAALTFSKPLRLGTATNLANFTITGPNGAVTVLSATLDLTGAIVTLGIPPLLVGSNYTVTVSNVQDLPGNLIAPGSQAIFTYVPNSISIQADQPGLQVASNLFGIFFEEISSAGDGGLYGELVRNRSFEDNATNADYWTLVSSGGGGQIALDRSLPLSATNATSLRIGLSGSGNAGAANSGYWGIPVSAGASYNLNLFARCATGFAGQLAVSLESTNGATVYSLAQFSGLTTAWQHFSAAMRPATSDPNARLVVRISQPGTVWVDFVSLFPQQTFNNRTNGLRVDLANMLADLRPSFMRFPGGAWVDGVGVPNFYNWETTVGDPANRVPRSNVWGYMVDNGLGYHEYLQLCEDLGMAPLFVVNCGMDYSTAVATNQLGPYIQQALDAIEYANGDTNTAWGAQRAANGHPATFNLQYMEIGNENGGSAYNDHYAYFYDAIKSRYPQMALIANTTVTSRPMDIVDEHYYPNTTFFIQGATRYDSYSRTGPKVFVGEYAVTSGSGSGNLAGALAEAAFMTGMERNSDVVILASYAPLFANLRNKNWNPDLIYFTGTQTYGTPSYYVQQMFSLNRGDSLLPATVTARNPVSTNHGAIGLGNWNTQSAYSNLLVSALGQTLYQSDFVGQGTNGWQFASGTWVATNGVFEQTAGGVNRMAIRGSTSWSNYTYTLQAMKLGGSEGFLIMFNVLDTNNFMWWNIGGWNNTQTGIEWSQNGSKTLLAATPMSIQSGQWYNIRIELSDRMRCFLNGTLIHDVPSTTNPLTVSTTLARSRGQLIVKAVNTSASPLTTFLTVNSARALSPDATATVLTSTNALDENSLAQPMKVSPTTNLVSAVASNFFYTFPGNSLTVLRLQQQPDSAVSIMLNGATNQQPIAALSNGLALGLSSFITSPASVNYTVDSPAGVLATGTVQFMPGDLARTIAFALGDLSNSRIIRVTLSNPVGAQLAGPTRLYYVNLPDIAGQPQIGLAQFPDETLLYWSNAATVLQQTGDFTSSWITTTNVPSPLRITMTNQQQFYRLEKTP